MHRVYVVNGSMKGGDKHHLYGPFEHDELEKAKAEVEAMGYKNVWVKPVHKL